MVISPNLIDVDRKTWLPYPSWRVAGGRSNLLIATQSNALHLHGEDSCWYALHNRHKVRLQKNQGVTAHVVHAFTCLNLCRISCEIVRG